MTGTFTLAHLSDPHLGPLPAFGPRDWNMKRALGFANWHRNRKVAHDPVWRHGLWPISRRKRRATSR